MSQELIDIESGLMSDADLLIKVGYLEGKIAALEQWKVSYEAKIEERLSSIQESLDAIMAAVNKGLGARWLGTLLFGSIILMPSFITSLHTFVEFLQKITSP